MTMQHELDEVLRADPVDAGCAAGFEVLHRYVEEQLEGGQPKVSHPGVEAHLRSCPACLDDYCGLLDAAATFGDAYPTDR